jgi:hypothetical protein
MSPILSYLNCSPHFFKIHFNIIHFRSSVFLMYSSFQILRSKFLMPLEHSSFHVRLLDLMTIRAGEDSISTSSLCNFLQPATFFTVCHKLRKKFATVDGRGSIPDRGKRFFSTLLSPDRLWGPPGLHHSKHRRPYLALGIKRPEREADHSPPSSAEVKIGWAIGLPPIPHASSRRDA